jgi:hypothetical protein
MLKQILFVYGGGEGRVREESDRTGVRVAGRRTYPHPESTANDSVTQRNEGV